VNSLKVKRNPEYVKSRASAASALSSTLASVISATAARLKEHGIDSATSEAEQILSHVLRQPRHQLHLNSRLALTEKQSHKVQHIVERRCTREPLQYILGTAEFYGLEIDCTPAALIPRPETELLVETVIKLAKNFPAPRILELGAGTGCIALALAAHLQEAKILATDISKDALLLARRNAERLELSHRVSFLRKDMLDSNSLDDIEQQHLIVSNPPYVLESERADLQPEIRDWEPEAALYVEGDGLKFYRAIVGLAQRRLTPDGFVAVEMASQRAEQIAEVFTNEGLAAQEIVKDYNGQQRHLIATKTSA
jgi:release factor glutamine methyltransferase